MKHIHIALMALIITSAPSWAKEDTGKIVSVAKDSVVVGKKHAHSYKIDSRTEITVNGIRSPLRSVKKDMKATVSAEGEVATKLAVVDAPFKDLKLDTTSLKSK